MKGMKESIRTFLKTNPGYKLLALFLAFLLWLMVYNTQDPNITRTYTTSVTILNADAVTEMNKCYEVAGNSGNVTFAVTGPRSVVDSLTESDFTVTADMENLVIAEDGATGTVTIEMKAPSRYASSVKFNSKGKKLEVNLENLDSKQFIVQAEYSGTVAESYALGSVSVINPNVLKVSGPQSVIEAIDRVVATIDVDGMSQDLSDNVIPILYDAAGQTISTNRLTLSNTTVSIQARILGTKSVGLLFSTSGTPAEENMVVSSIQSSSDSVMIKGSASVLNSVTNIEVPASALNINGAVGDVTTTIDITEYLPDGADLVNASDANVKVTVHMETYGSKTINIPTAAIVIEGLDDDLKVDYQSSTISLTVYGSESNLAEVGGDSVTATINLSKLRAGSHNVQVSFDLDSDKYTYSAVKVSLTLQDKSEN